MLDCMWPISVLSFMVQIKYLEKERILWLRICKQQSQIKRKLASLFQSRYHITGKLLHLQYHHTNCGLKQLGKCEA